MDAEFHYPIGGDKPFRSNKPTFFNRHKKRSHHPNLAEHDSIPPPPPVPAEPPPAVYEASVFGLIDAKLQYAINDAGYKVPTPIQEKSIKPLIDGRDMIGCAQTGTGKTAAFMLPILHHLIREGAAGKNADSDAGHPRALVLSPTRELAAQTAENTSKFSKYTGIPFAVVFGGVSQFPQEKAIRRGADVVIATPGRLIDLMTQGVIYLDSVELFVLDEADRMLDMGFLPDIKRIISKLPVKRQSMFFSATLSPQILKLAGELVHDPVQVMISPETPTVDKINQRVMLVDKGNKDNLLIHLLQTHPEWRKVIVFARTRHGADRVERKLRHVEVSVAAIHSDKTQNQRTRALAGFKEGMIRVLVATDIASRGIDVPSVSLVVNMELPVETESYVHRIGRTARAGADGCAISFVSPEERGLLKAVERFIKKTIQVDRDQPYHSEAADRMTGKQNEGLPQAPWVKGDRRHERGEGRGDEHSRGGAPKPGGGTWMKREKKYVHPANAKRSHRQRMNYAGRRQADFGGHREGV